MGGITRSRGRRRTRGGRSHGCSSSREYYIDGRDYRNAGEGTWKASRRQGRRGTWGGRSHGCSSSREYYIDGRGLPERQEERAVAEPCRNRLRKAVPTGAPPRGNIILMGRITRSRGRRRTRGGRSHGCSSSREYYIDGRDYRNAGEGARKASRRQGRRGTQNGGSHGCSSSREYYIDGRDYQTPEKAYGSRAASREGFFSRLHILWNRRSKVGADVRARSIEEPTCPIGNRIADQSRLSPPPKRITKPLDSFVESPTKALDQFVVPPASPGNNKDHGVNARTPVKKLHGFVITFIRTTGLYGIG